MVWCCSFVDRCNIYFPQVINDQLVRLYIIPNRKAAEGLPETTVFKTKTKFEIGDIRWFPLDDVNQRSCYNARPFLQDIKIFVGDFKEAQLALIDSRKVAKEEKMKTLADETSMWDECGVNFIDSDEMKKHKQSDHHGEQLNSISEDFIPEAWTNFSLDHEHLLELSLNFD